MPATTIQYTVKDKTGEAPETLWRDIDANEVKTVVNAHAADIDSVTALALAVFQSSQLNTNLINTKQHSSVVRTASFNPFDTGFAWFTTHVCGAEGIEVQLPNFSGNLNYDVRCRVVALGHPVTITVSDASTQILTGPTTIPVNGVVEITRVNIGNNSLTRYVVLPLFTP